MDLRTYRATLYDKVTEHYRQGELTKITQELCMHTRSIYSTGDTRCTRCWLKIDNEEKSNYVN